MDVRSVGGKEKKTFYDVGTWRVWSRRRHPVAGAPATTPARRGRRRPVGRRGGRVRAAPRAADGSRREDGRSRGRAVLGAREGLPRSRQRPGRRDGDVGCGVGALHGRRAHRRGRRWASTRRGGSLKCR
jgi:hypothetical protein